MLTDLYSFFAFKMHKTPEADKLHTKKYIKKLVFLLRNRCFIVIYYCFRPDLINFLNILH